MTSTLSQETAAPAPPPRPPAPRGRRALLAARTGRQRAADWGAALAVTALALLLRLYHLGRPDDFAFDETYYAKDAWSLLNFGYVRDHKQNADQLILDGRVDDVWTDGPSMIVHPEVGKWLIAAGEWAFGMDPFGWRISAVVAGSLMVLAMCRLARRLTGSTLLGCVAGLLLCLDGMQLVLSRLGLLDIFLALFLLVAVACVVADRDAARTRLERRGLDVPVTRGWGPVRALLWRPWLLAAGVAFGLAVGTKWTALYPMALLGVLVWLWGAALRRGLGVRWATLRSAVVDGLPAFAYLVLVASVVYVASWTGWLMNAAEYEESLSSTQYTQYVAPAADCDSEPESDPDARWATATEPDASGLGEVTQSLRSLAIYHRDVYVFHTQFLDCSDHTYESSPWGWPLLGRPVGVDAQLDIKPGEQGCDAAPDSDCLRQVLILGTPVLWWGGAVALLASAALWVGRRDWRYGLPVLGALSTWLPWLANSDRPIFLFYAVAMLPFTVLALTMVMGALIGPGRGSSPRRTAGVVVAGSFVLLVLVNFAWFWPIWTDGLLTNSEWLDRIWFSRWI
ncbi:dolichyl-phosphate-mannose--protein mannosyltransferase [Nocardioides sp. CFH 31398]|uniref:dolichyl-phosphate-mannose--protein mannosyltransferase n=1 Tax=Nocardioides sp. CFH 31398 TaxID=2919579 RepID=UPI001F05FE98|nr:phospholipid carrier-dependent glycosyltransferase [Nocardioides sp. CFH 31398]MCH1865344.1 phospholipid carrier-dependent glycosyltransferase [Nocardioides sp. CFH 31398]